MAKTSFRSPREQARHIVSSIADHGTSRHNHKEDGLIHSLGSERNAREAISRFGKWLREERHLPLSLAMRHDCIDYLERRAEYLQQASLNQDRLALNHMLVALKPGSERLPVVKSEIETIRSTRAYSAEQVAAIMAAQAPSNALATELAYRCGLRAHEMLSIRPAYQQLRSGHREWRNDLFKGREGVPYSVQGKGGLIREISVPRDLAERLESRRLEEPQRVTDRGIRYITQYDIGGGQRWSQSFSAASQRQLGWSQGGHGCRHAYAQQRMSELQGGGYSYEEAMKTLAQEIGHFSVATVSAYLR